MTNHFYDSSISQSLYYNNIRLIYEVRVRLEKELLSSEGFY